MIEIIKEIILDFQDLELTTGVTRRFEVTPVAGKATVCIGVRRSGKSTFMFQLMRRLLDAGISRQNILYLNFFDDRLHRLQHDGLSVILEAYFSLFPEKKNSEKVYCFFDEIQVVSGWEPFVDRLMRTKNVRYTSPVRPRRCCHGKLPRKCEAERCPGRYFPSPSGSFSNIKTLRATVPCLPRNAFLSKSRSQNIGEPEGSPKSPD